MVQMKDQCELFNMLYLLLGELEHLAIDKAKENTYNECAK